MKSNTVAYGASALLLALLSGVDAGGHGRVHNAHNHGLKHHHHHNVHSDQKRSSGCSFPSDAGLVSVTPQKDNAGWAMSPDQPCKPGNYCPYACPPGMVMAQWDPSATSYFQEGRMNGGLFCDESGQVQKPFPDKPYCEDATGALSAKNKAGDVVSFCQTVLPGNEAMLIPTEVTDVADLAVPNPSYWCSTSAHYYINPPGVDTDTACVWGTKDNPWGNWAPYVAGANSDDTGNAFIKLGWNPIYLEPETPFNHKRPKFGVRIECDGNCNGLPCEIDPSKSDVNSLTGSSGTTGAGSGEFCVVTAPKGSTANIVVFDTEGGGGEPAPPSEPSSEPSSSSSPPPPSSSSTFVSSSPSTSKATPSPTSSPPPSSSSNNVMPHIMVETSASASHATSKPLPSSSIIGPSNSSTLHMPTASASPSTTDVPAPGAASAISVSMSLLLALLAVFVFIF